MISDLSIEKSLYFTQRIIAIAEELIHCLTEYWHALFIVHEAGYIALRQFDNMDRTF